MNINESMTSLTGISKNENNYTNNNISPFKK